MKILNTPMIKRVPLVAALCLASGTALAAPEVHQVKFGYKANEAMKTIFNVKLVNGQLQLMNPQAAMTLGDGQVVCENNRDYRAARLYLGPVFYVNNSIAPLPGTLMDTSVSVASGTVNLVEGVPANSLAMDINMSQVGKHVFDPVAVVQAELAEAKSQGMSEQEFFASERLFMVERAITLAGRCSGPQTNPNAGWEIDTVENVKFLVKNIGLGPAAQGLAVQAPPPPPPTPVVPLGGQNWEAPVTPLQITSGSIIAYAPNYVGECPRTLKFKAVAEGAGEGMVAFHVDEPGALLDPLPLTKMVWQGTQRMVVFDYDVKLDQMTLGQKQNRTFNLSYSVKQPEDAGWNNNRQQLATLNWAYTCKPQVAVPTGRPGKIAPNNIPEPTLPRAVAPMPKPVPVPVLTIKSPPRKPDPATRYAPEPVKPVPSAPPKRANPDPVKPKPALTLKPAQTDAPRRAE